MFGLIFPAYICFVSTKFVLLPTGAGITLSSSKILCEYAGDVAIAHKIAVVEIGTIDVVCWLVYFEFSKKYHPKHR